MFLQTAKNETVTIRRANIIAVPPYKDRRTVVADVRMFARLPGSRRTVEIEAFPCGVQIGLMPIGAKGGDAKPVMVSVAAWKSLMHILPVCGCRLIWPGYRPTAAHVKAARERAGDLADYWRWPSSRSRHLAKPVAA